MNFSQDLDWRQNVKLHLLLWCPFLWVHQTGRWSDGEIKEKREVRREKRKRDTDKEREREGEREKSPVATRTLSEDLSRKP